MRALRSLLGGLLLAVLLVGCTRTVVVSDGPVTVDDRNHHGSKKHALGIPPGHLPPPGSCRIWIPGVPPGRQSPPGDCHRLAREVPPGAWLVTRSHGEPRYVEVSVFDERRAGVVVGVEIYLAATGKWVGHRLAR